MTTGLERLLEDALASGAVGAVLFLAVATWIVILVQFLQTRRTVATFGSSLRSRVSSWTNTSPQSSLDPLWSEVQRVFVFRPEPKARIVVRESPEPGLVRQVLRLNHAGPGGAFVALVGEHLTAIALIVTFALLGAVLMGDIQAAVTAPGNDSKALALGLGKMGAKFFVSAAGIAGAWLAHVLSTFAQDRLKKRVAELTRSLDDLVEPMDVFHARISYAGAQRVQAIAQDVVHVRDQLKKLESINVSVQGLGNEVVAHVGQIMRQQAADVICESIQKLEDSVTEIARTLANSLQDSFAEELKQVTTGLGGVQKAIEGQAQSNLDRVVGQLGNIVSGGFRSQSEDMGRQLGQLAEVLPKLQSQFASLTDGLGHNAQVWGEQNQLAIAELSRQVSGLVGQFETVRTGIDAAVNNMAEASKGIIRDVSQVAIGQGQAMATEVASMRTAAAEDASAFRQRAQGFTELMSRTQVEVGTALRAIRETIAVLVTGLEHAKQAQGDQRLLLHSFDGAASKMTDGARQVDLMLGKQSEVLAREGQLLVEQRQSIDKVAQVLDGMFRSHTEALTRQSNELADSWGKQAHNIRNVVETVSNSLQDSVDELGQVLKQAVVALKPPSGPAT